MRGEYGELVSQRALESGAREASREIVGKRRTAGHEIGFARFAKSGTHANAAISMGASELMPSRPPHSQLRLDSA